MKHIIESITNLSLTIGLLFGTGKTLIWLHNEIKKETLTTISKGLSSTEVLSKVLTGE